MVELMGFVMRKREARDWNLQLEWNPRDCWIGVYWQREGNCVDVWICIIPMLPLHFSCWGERWGMKEPKLDGVSA